MSFTFVVTAVTLFALSQHQGEAAGRFTSAPVFNEQGLALAVFDGGTRVELHDAASAVGASGVWVRDALGGSHLLVVGGPAFLMTEFDAVFPDGFPRATAVTLVRQSEAAGSTRPQATTGSGRIVRNLAPVRAGPGSQYAVIWRLYEGTQVVVMGEDPGADGATWRRIRLWGSYDGWLDQGAISVEPYPPLTLPLAPGAAPSPVAPSAPPPASTTAACGALSPSPSATQQTLMAPATVLVPATLRGAPNGAVGNVTLPAGASVLVDAWTTGADGHVLYHLHTGERAGWAAAGSVALQSADAATRQVGGRPIVEPLRGLGVWFVLDTREHGEDAGARVVRAAREKGITHLYVEVATSRGGFFGKQWLDELLPAARAAGVKVIGSVYTCLSDVPADLALALEVARYRTPGGIPLDGLTADIEETLITENIQAFGQLLRHDLGDDYLLVATTYPPESWAARHYPWRTLGSSWNAVAPMAYWRQMEERAFTPQEVYAYITRNVASVRMLAGRPDLPVDVLGQLFEMGRPLLLGPNPPTPAEIKAAAAAARDAGAVGVSFFDWTRATPAHWEALAEFTW